MVIKEINSDVARGICCLQFDDKIYFCNQNLTEKEKPVRTRFRSKPAVNLERENNIKFSASILSNNGHNLAISQTGQIQNLSILDTNKFNMEQFLAERALGAYVAAVCRPDVAYSFSRLAQFSDPTEQKCMYLKRLIN